VSSLKAFLDTLDAEYGGGLTYAGMDQKGAILHHPTALEDALALGKRLAVPER
jgi:hypothetical protein